MSNNPFFTDPIVTCLKQRLGRDRLRVSTKADSDLYREYCYQRSLHILFTFANLRHRSVVLKGLQRILRDDRSAQTTAFDLYLCTYLEGSRRKPRRIKILSGTAIEEIGLCEYMWTLGPGDGKAGRLPSPGLEDVDHRIVIGGTFALQELFPDVRSDLSQGAQFQMAAFASVRQGILQFEIFSKPDGSSFLECVGSGCRAEIQFRGETDPAKVRYLMSRDNSLVQNSCHSEWVALVMRLESNKASRRS